MRITNNRRTRVLMVLGAAALVCQPLVGANAAMGDGKLRQVLAERRAASEAPDTSSTTAAVAANPALDTAPHKTGKNEVTLTFGGRDVILYIPANLPPRGQRAIVFSMHGGGGNAEYTRAKLNMDPAADQGGFIMAYLNGTQAAANLPSSMKSWNAGGGCCGLAYDNNVDDVGYITNVVAYLSRAYGARSDMLFAIGHSNGAIMSQMMMCKTNVFRAAVPISGTLASDVTSCPAAKGKRLMAIHGELDENVPIVGGTGTKGPNKAKNVNYRSEASSKAIFEQYGASYTANIVAGAPHDLAELNAAVAKRDGIGIGETAARFFGLAKK